MQILWAICCVLFHVAQTVRVAQATRVLLVDQPKARRQTYSELVSATHGTCADIVSGAVQRNNSSITALVCKCPKTLGMSFMSKQDDVNVYCGMRKIADRKFDPSLVVATSCPYGKPSCAVSGSLSKDEGFTACTEGHLEVVRQFLDNRAVNVVNVDSQRRERRPHLSVDTFNVDRTCLYLASEMGHLKVAKLLLKHRAIVDAATSTGATSLHIASEKGHIELAELLLDRRATVDAEKSDGKTSLLIASVYGHLEVAKLLLEHGASANAPDIHGVTPLKSAIHMMNSGAKNSGSSFQYLPIIGHLLFSAQTAELEAQSSSASPEGSVRSECEMLRAKVLQTCEDFWSSLLGSALLADIPAEQRSKETSRLPSRCGHAFTAVWQTSGNSILNDDQKLLLFVPLFAKALDDGFLTYPSQMFWAGFTHRYSSGLSSRALVDSFAAEVGSEDCEFPGRPLGTLLRQGVWQMQGDRVLSSGRCHKTKQDANFWTLASEFWASLKGAAQKTYVLINYNEAKLKGSFLWNVEVPSMAEVCMFDKAAPAFVVIDLHEQCGTIVDEFFRRLQDLCDDKRRQWGWEDQVDLGLDCASRGTGCPSRTACACKGCAKPARLERRTAKMWDKAMRAIDELRERMDEEELVNLEY